jgi:hypothetical protein
MPLSWNEIRHRAIAFNKEWKPNQMRRACTVSGATETREAAERQSFWNDFFNVFGVRRRTVAAFEEPVKKLFGDRGVLDDLLEDGIAEWISSSRYPHILSRRISRWSLGTGLHARCEARRSGK